MTEGWAAIPNWLVRHPEVTPNMTAVYAVIQSHAGSKGTTRLLLQTIADEAGMSYSTAQRSVKALNALGVLWWEAQGSATRRTASIYHPLQESDPARVEQAHKPASKRKPVRSDGTVTGTVLTQVNPQDSAVPDEPVRSERVANTVTAVRSQGPYVRSQGPREEEPSKKNSPPPSPPPPSSSSDSSSEREPAPIEFDGAWMSLVWRPRIEAMKHAAEHYPGVDLYAVTVQYIEYAMGKGWDLTSGYWLAQVKRQHDHENREQIGYDEAYDETVRRAREEAQRRWNEARGIE